MKKVILRLALIAGPFWVAAGPLAAATSHPNEFEFAETTIGDWTLRAETEISWSGGNGTNFPRIADVHCFGESNDAQFNMNATGGFDHFRLKFAGDADTEGEKKELTLFGDRLWVFIDGARWEHAWFWDRGDDFKNVQYPKVDHGEDIVIPSSRGHAAFRQHERDSWIHSSRMIEKILGARKLEWAFKSRNWNEVDSRQTSNALPAGWQTKRYAISMSSAQSAVNWCARQVGSDTARTLPTVLLPSVGK